MQTTRKARAVGVALLSAGVIAAALTGCSSNGSNDKGSSGGSAGGTYTFWDPYPQYDASSDWAKLIDQCGTDAGVTVKRTGYDTSDLTNKALLAGQQSKSPDILLVDNPVVSTLADAGILTDTKENGLSTGQIAENILGAGVQGGKTYGVPIGANTLALYYNPKVLQAAGVDPASITSWDSLTAALAKVKAAGKKGITFAGINTEEGSFQFLPWFWGAGADLTKLDSSKAEAALSLWAGWIKDGYAPNSVIQDTQTTSWQEFQTGDFAFGENGTWQKAAAAQMGAGVITIPAQSGGAAPVPTGGEFFTIPVQKDTARYKTSAKIIECLSQGDNIVKTDTTLNYIVASKAGQAKQLAADSSLKTWIDAVGVAKARTGDNLGTKYPVISQQLWTAVQKAESGAASPSAALKAAQDAVDTKLNK
ncbi:sugar ABC transporter substrate-binding protein [Gryllotalpicola koreensis]|uniref:ABC transporter substrate-binding protein n=1 Tax=Gryllotalpicola koreensis TaxID=993086 RepID=A0ABP7ZZP1_9MICO